MTALSSPTSISPGASACQSPSHQHRSGAWSSSCSCHMLHTAESPDQLQIDQGHKFKFSGTISKPRTYTLIADNVSISAAVAQLITCGSDILAVSGSSPSAHCFVINCGFSHTDCVLYYALHAATIRNLWLAGDVARSRVSTFVVGG